MPEIEHLHLNFQLLNNTRSDSIFLRKAINYNVVKNIMLNRFVHLNGMIKKDWMNLSIESYKIKCKLLFLSVNSDANHTTEHL